MAAELALVVEDVFERVGKALLVRNLAPAVVALHGAGVRTLIFVVLRVVELDARIERVGQSLGERRLEGVVRGELVGGVVVVVEQALERVEALFVAGVGRDVDRTVLVEGAQQRRLVEHVDELGRRTAVVAPRQHRIGRVGEPLGQIGRQVDAQLRALVLVVDDRALVAQVVERDVVLEHLRAARGRDVVARAVTRAGEQVLPRPLLPAAVGVDRTLGFVQEGVGIAVVVIRPSLLVVVVLLAVHDVGEVGHGLDGVVAVVADRHLALGALARRDQDDAV